MMGCVGCADDEDDEEPFAMVAPVGAIAVDELAVGVVVAVEVVVVVEVVRAAELAGRGSIGELTREARMYTMEGLR